MSGKSAKKNKKKLLIRLVSSESPKKTITFVRSRKQTSPKLSMKKYDPRLRKHVIFEEKKMK